MRTDRDGAASLPDVRDERSDDELLRAAATGDRQAFETYYRHNAPWLEIRLRRRCGDADLAPAPSAEEEALASSYGAELALALDRLSPELRADLQATVLDGLSVRETSVLLDIPEGTVKSRAVRARRQLREALA